MELLSAILRDVGFLLYGGPMVAWAVLIQASGRLHSVEASSIVRVFRSWGPGFGLSLGTCVLGALLGRYLEHSSFQWSLATPEAQLDAAAWGFFLLMWISNIKLEIWTLEPFRKVERHSPGGDESLYDAGTSKLRSHLRIHAILVLAVAICGTLSGS